MSRKVNLLRLMRVNQKKSGIFVCMNYDVGFKNLLFHRKIQSLVNCSKFLGKVVHYLTSLWLAILARK